ncbi:MAG: phosphatase RsbU N-terminal domain-containing protein, partial [Candidatus Geothermincolia bacterium]
MSPVAADPPRKTPLTFDRFKERYSAILGAFLATGSEEPLLEASELGKKALESNIGLLDIAATHTALIPDVLEALPAEHHGAVAEQASRVLLECLAAYEISSRGFWDMLEEIKKKSEQDVKAIFASAQDAVLLFNQEGLLLDFNDAYAGMLGYSRDELRGLGPGGLPVGSFPVLDEGALRQLADRGYFDEYETGFARRDGSAVVATMSGAMLGSAQ